MAGPDPEEYDLSEIEEPARPKAAPVPPGQPLPRIWKTEPDEEATGSPVAPKVPAGVTETDRPAKAVKPKRSPDDNSASQGKNKPEVVREDGRKILKEETPSLDTYESRQRARLVMGGLVAACFLIALWIGYRLFIYDPNAIEVPPDESMSTQPATTPKRDLEGEARAMFVRAQDHAKHERTREAISLLEKVTKTYKGTPSAKEALEALERPRQNLPLFLDRPAVTADTPPPAEPQAPPLPPAVVVAEASPGSKGQGTATLVLPANPPELTPAHASSLATAGKSVEPAPVRLRPLPRGFKPMNEGGVSETGWPNMIVGDRDGAPMVLVPGGTFTQGNDGGQPAEGPVHQVRLSTYYIDQHEVTVRQFRLFLGESRYRGNPPKAWSFEAGSVGTPSLGDTTPMVNVTARDADAYAAWANKRLPTEAQWEAAARSPDGRIYPWGQEPIVYSRPHHRLANPVMTLPEDRSPYGVFDLGGNVLEWTSDWFDPRYYRTLTGQAVENPSGPGTKPRSLLVVVKGIEKGGRASGRMGIQLDSRMAVLGFRCVLPVEGTGAITTPPGPLAHPPPPGQAPSNPPQAPGQGAVPVPF